MAGDAPIKSTTSTVSYDRETFLAAQLLERAHQKLVAVSLCDKVKQPEGTGLTAYFVRYKRMNVPVSTLTEGTDPSDSTLELEQVTATLDLWGDVLTITDVARLTTKHPLFNIAMDLLADNAARVMDREVQEVWLSGTNVFYPNSKTARTALVAADKLTDTVLQKVRITMANAGAPPREGPSTMAEKAAPRAAAGQLVAGAAYVAVCGPEVTGDIMAQAASAGMWVNVAQYQNQKAVYNAEVGTYLGFRFVETNFIPKFTLLGSSTRDTDGGSNTGGITGMTASVGVGSLGNATFFFKITRKSLTRGFEEDISISHSLATGGTSKSVQIVLPSTAGYVYNVYFDTESGGGDGSDAQLGLYAENQAAGATVNCTAVATGAAPPAAITTASGTAATAIHPVFVHGAGSCKWVGLKDLEVMTTGDEATTHNPLKLRKMISYKFYGKAMLPDQDRLARIEVASAFST